MRLAAVSIGLGRLDQSLDLPGSEGKRREASTVIVLVTLGSLDDLRMVVMVAGLAPSRRARSGHESERVNGR
jgi:hypothetical protein